MADTNEPLKSAIPEQPAVGYPMQAPVPPRFMNTNGEPNK